MLLSVILYQHTDILHRHNYRVESLQRPAMAGNARLSHDIVPEPALRLDQEHPIATIYREG